jgi:hypothetical protein
MRHAGREAAPVASRTLKYAGSHDLQTPRLQATVAWSQRQSQLKSNGIDATSEKRAFFSDWLIERRPEGRQ